MSDVITALLTVFCGAISAVSGAPQTPDVPPPAEAMLVDSLVPIFGMLIPIVFFIALFSFLAVAKRMDNRRKEQEAHEKYEFLKKMAEGGALDVQKYVEFQQAEGHMQRQRRIEGLNLAGMILAGVGVAMIPFFYFVTDPELATIGLLPLGVGVALFFGARWMSRTSPQA